MVPRAPLLLRRAMTTATTRNLSLRVPLRAWPTLETKATEAALAPSTLARGYVLAGLGLSDETVSDGAAGAPARKPADPPRPPTPLEAMTREVVRGVGTLVDELEERPDTPPELLDRIAAVQAQLVELVHAHRWGTP